MLICLVQTILLHHIVEINITRRRVTNFKLVPAVRTYFGVKQYLQIYWTIRYFRRNNYM